MQAIVSKYVADIKDGAVTRHVIAMGLAEVVQNNNTQIAEQLDAALLTWEMSGDVETLTDVVRRVLQLKYTAEGFIKEDAQRARAQQAQRNSNPAPVK